MPKPMTRFTVDKPKVELHSFVANRFGAMCYAKYGSIYVVPNKKLADNKVTELATLGFNCQRSFDYPFTVQLIESK